jgi:hypothetical protein
VATRAIYCSPEHKAAVDALHQYLGKHGQHITSLHFDTESFTDWYLFQGILIEQLPCPNLLDFGFQGDGWQLLPAGGTPHLLCACKSLTRLSLYTNDEVPGMLPSLSVLTDLRQLRSLEVVTYSSDDAQPAELEDSLDGDVLAQLPHLTKLQLAGEVRITTLRHISCLTALQELQVQLEYPVAEAEGSSAPQEHSQQQQQQQQQRAVLQHLTDLRLGAPGLLISSSTYPWLADLPALRHAVYTVGLLEPQVVSAAPQLTALMVTALTDIAGGASGLREFLSSLRSLQQLTCCSLEASSTAADILVPDACSCLTASSRLQKLSLFGWSFPIGGWQHMFPAGVQLGLTYQDLRGAQGERINTDALQRLVQCCPDLRELVLVQATQRSNIDLGPLMQLSALTKLELGSILDPVDVSIRAVEWSSAVNCLKQLPSLRHLVMATSDVLLLTETLELTVLTDLSHLQLYILQDRTVIRQSWEVIATYGGFALVMMSHQWPHADVVCQRGAIMYDMYTSPSAAETALGTWQPAVHTYTLHALTGFAPTSCELLRQHHAHLFTHTRALCRFWQT